VIAKAFCEYETLYPRDSWAEQDPEKWWKAVVKTTKSILNQSPGCIRKILAIGLSGQMLGCLPLDKKSGSLRRSIVHSDTRSFSQ